MKKRWKKGVGEFVGFTITSVALLGIFIMILSSTLYNNTKEIMNDSIGFIARNIVACESLEDAQELAQEQAESLLKGNSLIEADTITADVTYAAGSKQEWEKGNFVVVFLSARFNHTGFFGGTYKDASMLVMIERSGG